MAVSAPEVTSREGTKAALARITIIGDYYNAALYARHSPFCEIAYYFKGIA